MSIGKFVCVPLSAGLLFSSSAYALENCVTPPSCEELGFTVNVEDCTGSSLKCPWDLSKAACKVNTNKPISCTVGSVLDGDQLCYEAGKLPDGISPIGIVFDEENRLAVALTDVKKDGSADSETMYWAEKSYDIPSLKDCQYSDGDAAVDSCGIDGRANTTAILGCGSNCGTRYAAKAANTYNPSNCSADFCKQNQWFLPSMRDLVKIYANKSIINASLSLLSSFGAKALTESYYWSSTEHSNTYAWRFHMGSGYRVWSGKTGSSYVRPVVKY